MASPYTTDLDRNAANHVALTPLSFLERAAAVHPVHPALVHGLQRFTWGGTRAEIQNRDFVLRWRFGSSPGRGGQNDCSASSSVP